MLVSFLCGDPLVLFYAVSQPLSLPLSTPPDYIPDIMASASGVGSYSNPLKKFK